MNGSCYESFGREELLGGCMEAMHILGMQMPTRSGGCSGFKVQDGGLDLVEMGMNRRSGMAYSLFARRMHRGRRR